MNRSMIFSLLERNQQLLGQCGVEQIGLFGSFVRNEQTDQSDIDMHPTLTEFLFHIKDEVEFCMRETKDLSFLGKIWLE